MTNDINYDPQNSGCETGVFLQPIAAPSVLGLYGLAGATFMVAANMAHWFTGGQSGLVVTVFAAFFGGLAQFLAAMWAFRARDGLATAIHGVWGSFWMAYGILNVIYVLGLLGLPPGSYDATAIGYWFIVLAAISWVCTAGATAESQGLAAVMVFFALGATAAAIGNLLATEAVLILAGWLLIIGSFIAWYVASAMMLEKAYRRTVWPYGARILQPVVAGEGEPGVIRGQA